jgi:hypothetical protein
MTIIKNKPKKRRKTVSESKGSNADYRREVVQDDPVLKQLWDALRPVVDSSIARDNLRERGLSFKQIADHYRYIGEYRKEGWKLINRTMGTLERGQFAQGVFTDGGELSRRLANSILIPTYSLYGGLVGMKARRLDEDDIDHGKYVQVSRYRATHCPQWLKKRLLVDPEYVRATYAGHPSAIPDDIWSDYKNPPPTMVLITEGELKADIATALGAHYCLGLPGLDAPNDLIPTLQRITNRLPEIEFVIAFDNELSRRTDNAKVELYRHISGLATTLFARWNGPKGIDELIKLGGNWEPVEEPPLAFPIIKIVGGELPRIVDQAEEALLEKDSTLYQRAGLMVRPVWTKLKAAHDQQTFGYRMVTVSKVFLAEMLTRVAEFQQGDIERDAWEPVDCPLKIAETYLAREQWKLRVLTGVISAPMLRADGSILDQPGYDAATGLLFEPRGVKFPLIPKEPTKADATEALELLKALIVEFPFVDLASRSVSLSGILTALDRRSLDHAPLHGHTATAAGTGKSLQADIASVISTGERAPTIGQGGSEEEFEKRLGAALIAGDAIISIDNCESPLGGELLCRALTQEVCDVRWLGESRNVRVLSNTMMFANGNGLAFAGDVTRRALLGAMDAKMERPELRQFEGDLIERVKERRAELVVAALTVLRAYHLAQEKVTVEPYGGFEMWSRRIREALVWLGEADPCKTIEETRARDVNRGSLEVVLQQWMQHVPGDVSVSEVIKLSSDGFAGREDLQSALMAVAGMGRELSSKKLGWWLGRNEGRIVSGLRVVKAGVTHGVQKWRVEDLTPKPVPAPLTEEKLRLLDRLAAIPVSTGGEPDQ